ncbi:MAG: CotH kinase family protein [Chloroflexota bacterium]
MVSRRDFLKLSSLFVLNAAVPAGRVWPGVTPALAADNAQLNTIAFSQDSVVTHQPLLLTLKNQAAGAIRYTTNGAVPSAASASYSGPIPINQSTVIRAQLFGADGAPIGPLYTKSYILANYEQTIPVMSVTADWGDLNSLHANPAEHGKEWERPINLEYFEPGGLPGFNVAAGIRIHGNFSRLFNLKKSYRIYFSKSYGGPGNLDYPVFEDTPVTKFDKLVLRAGFQDTFTHRGIPDRADRHLEAKYISDQVVRNLHRDMGQPIAHGRWVLLYLNGQFWGLYNLTERIDLQMLRSYSEKDAEWDVIVKESGWEEGVWYNREEVRDGGYGSWLENQNWVGGADFTIPENIGELEWRVNMENVFSYMFLQAYVQHTDWPSANWVVYRRWDERGLAPEIQWRMMVWDAEDTFGSGEGGQVDLNTLVRVYSPHDSITRILEKPFIGNCGFKHKFVNRAREYLGVENQYGKPETEVGQLSKERVRAEIIKQAEIVRPFIQMETERWAPDLPGPQIFEQNIQNMLHFVDMRQEVILHHLDELRYQTFTECK